MEEQLLKAENVILTAHVNRLMREVNKATIASIKMEAKNDALAQSVAVLNTEIKRLQGCIHEA